jgi:hypothetical protein
LEHWENQCVLVDKTFTELEQEKDEDAAYSLAISFAASALALARTESALLSSILPELQSDLDGTNEKMAVLDQRKRDAEDAIYDLRGSSGSVQPLSVEVDERRARLIKKTRKRRDKVFIEVREGLDKLRPEREPIMASIGKIKMMLRALAHFAANQFPVPQTKGRNPMSPTSPDPRADPLAAFASRWVDGMDGRGSAEAKALRAGQERTRIADQRAARDWDAIKNKNRRIRVRG